MHTNDNVMLAPERQDRIRAMLKRARVVRVEALAEDLEVSSATIRRDLLELEQQGLLRRVHGGAVGIESNLEEPRFDDKAGLMQAEKQRIAQAALVHVDPTGSVFLDGGSTVLALAHLLTGYTALTVVTNSLRVAGLLSTTGPRLIVAGGELRRLSQTFVGALTHPMLERLHVDTAFMGTLGLGLSEGLTTTDPREALTKDIAIRQARRVLLLSDSSKLEAVSFVRFGALDAIDLLITDSGATEAQRDALRSVGLEVQCV